MGIKTHQRNTKGRIDASTPKLPASIIVDATMADGEVTLIAAEGVRLLYNAAYSNISTALPGVYAQSGSQIRQVTTVTIGPANVAVLTFDVPLEVGDLLFISPLTQALRSHRGGLLALGHCTFPGNATHNPLLVAAPPNLGTGDIIDQPGWEAHPDHPSVQLMAFGGDDILADGDANDIYFAYRDLADFPALPPLTINFQVQFKSDATNGTAFIQLGFTNVANEVVYAFRLGTGAWPSSDLVTTALYDQNGNHGQNINIDGDVWYDVTVSYDGDKVTGTFDGDAMGDYEPGAPFDPATITRLFADISHGTGSGPRCFVRRVVISNP